MFLTESSHYEAARATLRAAMTRATEREGIPMIVALVDERRTMTRVVDAAVVETGQALAATVLEVRAELATTMPEGDNGGVISALVIAAHNLTKLAVTHA